MGERAKVGVEAFGKSRIALERSARAETGNAHEVWEGRVGERQRGRDRRDGRRRGREPRDGRGRGR